MSKSRFVALSGITLACAVSGCSDHRAASHESTAVVEERLLEAFETADALDVIVSFRDPAEASLSGPRAAHRRALRSVRESLAEKASGGFTPTRQFEHVPAVAGRLSRFALGALSQDPEVLYIQLDSPGHGALSVSVPAIGADVARSDYGVSGRGVRVAVLDTGANSSHPDLTSSILSTQRCFTQWACPPDSSAEGSSAEDDHGHGSHVSGIITSDGPVAGMGFAPDAEIVAVKINDRYDSGMVSDWVAGLDWVFSNLSTLDVRIVNLSICTDRLYGSQSQCDAGEPALASAIENLVNAGVTVFAASGNKGSSTEMAAPACNTGVIAVGATYKSDQGRQPSSGTYSSRFGSLFGDCADATTEFDQVACFTNSPERLDVLAPGAVITSDSLGSGTEQYWGTSQASPSAAGVAALMLECDPTLTPTGVQDILERTAVNVTDPKTGRSYPSIRAAAAVQEACSGAAGSGAGGEAGLGGNTGAGGNSGTGGDTGVGGGITALGGNTGVGGDTGVGGQTAAGGGPTGLGGNTGVGGGLTALGGNTGVGGSITALGGNTGVGGDIGVGGQTAAGGGITGIGGATGAGGAWGTGGAAATGVGGAPGVGGTNAVGGSVGLGGAIGLGGTTGVGAATGVGGRAELDGEAGVVATPDGSAPDTGGCSCTLPRRGPNVTALALMLSTMALGAFRRRRRTG